MYYNIHTHIIPDENTNISNIVNISVENISDIHVGIQYSIGIHPWYIKKEQIQKELDLIRKYAVLPNIKAIGECGLDKLCQSDFELQKEVFSSQILISEEINKPLIIHCVKSFDEIIALMKKHQPKQAWIIHGFRGKPEQAKQLVKKGIFLSFGDKYNENSMKNLSLKTLFFETDDSNSDIRDIYSKAAKTLGIPEENLIRQIEQNIRNIFGTHSTVYLNT